jgi:hypothetical protein
MAENTEKLQNAWRLFKNYVKNLHYLDNLLLIELGHNQYLESIRLVSEKYYDINTNLNIIINDKETINKKILNKKIGLLNNHMQNMIKIVEKNNNKFTAELKEYNTFLERIKSEKLTIQKYFMEEELKNKELEEEKQEQVKIINDELNPSHIRFEYF